MAEKKTMIRFFTIADYEEEEEWLREMHKNGWKLTRTALPCFYFFEKCEPEDVVYRLDYKNGTQDSEYMQMFKDYGWEYLNECMGWLYFRKSAASDGDMEIFSDDASRVEMIGKIVKTRLLPLAVIFLCCVMPNITGNVLRGKAGIVISIIFLCLFALYLYLFLHCGLKFRRLKKKYGGE